MSNLYRAAVTLLRNRSLSQRSASSAAGRIEKPELRNLWRYDSQNSFIMVLVASFAVAVGFKYTVAIPRKEKYKKFMETYDDDARTKFLIEHNIVNPEEFGVP